jgi:hypothetical protein
MIRIAITAEAFEAIKATLPVGSVLDVRTRCPPHRASYNGVACHCV